MERVREMVGKNSIKVPKDIGKFGDYHEFGGTPPNRPFNELNCRCSAVPFLHNHDPKKVIKPVKKTKRAKKVLGTIST
jgi:hypothetical protein